MVKLIVTVTCFTWIICCLIPAGAAPPAISFNYQGKLLGSGGEPVMDGSYTLAAAIFATDTGGTALWSGNYTAQVTGGVFSSIIGPLSTDVLSTAEGRFLQITINGSTLSPRTKLVSVPYAGVAAVATSVADSSITTAAIAAQAVSTGKISATGSTAGQVLTSSGSSVAWATPAGMTLPFLRSMGSDTTLFSVTSTGDSRAGEFKINGGSGDWEALMAESNSVSEAAFKARNNSGGPAAVFEAFSAAGIAGEFFGKARMTGFSLTSTPVNGYVLTCDASGNGTWQQPTVVDGSVTTAKIADSAVTSAKIVDGTIALADITGAGASANYVIKRNSGNTAWTFAADSDTAYTAGTGLSLASGMFSIADVGVTTAKIADSAVTSAKIADGAVALADITGTGASANYVIKRNSGNTAWTFAADSDTLYTAGAGLNLAGGIFSIADTGVTSAKIADSAVTSAKIQDLAIGSGDIANGAVTTAKISSTGAATGKALMYDGSSVVWGNPTASNITLPYTGSTSGAADAFSVTTTGMGRAGYFEADNTTDSTANALEVKANTTGSALYASTTGIATAVEGYASGTGAAGIFQIEHSTSYATALQSQTDGHGIAIKGLSTGDGTAGDFQISNASSAAVVLKSATNGTGKAALFQITNSANTSDTVYASTTGGGSAIKGYTTGTSYAGEFQITNSSNSANAVYAITNGTGSAIKGYTSGTNRAGEFQLANSSSSADALYATTNGYGNAVTGSAVTGSGGYFTANAASSRAVFGSATLAAGDYNYGGYFLAAGVHGTGVYGAATGTTSSSYGGYFQTASNTGSGVRARNTSNGNEGQLAGPDYGVKATGDLVVTGDAHVSGDLAVTGHIPYPRPAYNSGWVHLEQGTYVTLNHNVGGNIDDYVVDMQLKSVDGVINNIGLGRDTNNPYYDGAAYYILSNSQMWIQRYDTDSYAYYIRIRIWMCN